MFSSVVEPSAPAVQRLRQAAAVQAAAEAAQAQALLDLAHEVEWDETAEFDVVGTRPIRIAADGTRLIDEHLPLEVAAALGISATAAIWLIRDVLNLAARHPRLWQSVQARQFPLWRARPIAQLVEAAGLNHDEALAVDAAIADAVGRVGWRRLVQRLRAAMLQIAPDRLRAQAEASQAARYVRVGTLPDDPASSYLAGRLDTSVARDFDDLLDRVVFICASTRATAPAGTPCRFGDDCQSGMCIGGANPMGGSACSAPCVDDSDCPTAAPVCMPIRLYTSRGTVSPTRGCLPRR